MLSRVAENIYWLGRHVERAENAARVVAVNANLLLDLPRGIAPGWAPLVYISGANAQFEADYPDYGEASVVHFLLGDTKNTGSILSALAAAREGCRTIRDFVPREAWEVLNGNLFLEYTFGKSGHYRPGIFFPIYERLYLPYQARGMEPDQKPMLWASLNYH